MKFLRRLLPPKYSNDLNMWLNLNPADWDLYQLAECDKSGTVPRDIILSNTYYTSDMAKKDNKQVKTPKEQSQDTESN